MSLCELCVKLYECGDQGKIKCPLYKDDKEKHYSEKGNHAQRSKFHAPQHLKFWKKKEKASEGSDKTPQ